MKYANYNGRIETEDKATISSGNTAFKYGYGLFETMLVLNGDIQLKEYHFDRLFMGLRRLVFTLPDHFNRSFLEDELLKTIRKNGYEHCCRVRLQVFAADIKSIYPCFFIECTVPDESLLMWNLHGLKLGIAEGICKSPDSYSSLKTLSCFPYLAASFLGAKQNLDDMLILNDKQHIVETSIANVFWIKNHIVHTPGLSEGCIDGVMRRHLLHELSLKGFAIKESPCTQQELFAADELFLTNAIRRIKWIAGVGSHRYSSRITFEIHTAIFGNSILSN